MLFQALFKYNFWAEEVKLYDSTQSPSWWDNYGSGTTTGILNEGTNMKWTEANKQEAIPIAFAGTVINKTINMQILRVVTMNIDNGDSSTSTIGPGKTTVGTTTTTPSAPVVKTIEAKFELSSISEDVTAAELSTSTMKNAIAGNIAAAINVPANTVSIIAIYDCPGDDVRCDDEKRMRRLVTDHELQQKAEENFLRYQRTDHHLQQVFPII